MRSRVPPILAAAFLVLSLSSGTAGTARATGHMSPSFAMDSTPMADAGVMAPGANAYGLRTCQVGLSVGQCFDPYQMRKAYGTDQLIAAGFDGRGKTIVIVDAFMDPNIQQQLATFDTYYGLPAMNAGPGTPTFTEVAPDGVPAFDPTNANMTGWAEEISLDVLWAHAIAPGANIVLEEGLDNSDAALVSALNDAVNNNRGDVVSMSFGESDQCVGTDLTNAWHQAFANATLKGMTLFASSGDQGALQPSCDGKSWIKSTSSPASDPLVTAVGGTELHAADFCLTALGCDPTQHPAPGTWLGETSWNEGPPYGDFQSYFDATEASGGGFSTIWDAPAYQQGTIHGTKQAGVPDVAYNAAILHGVLTYLNLPGIPVGWYRFGGTSAGSPQWAAMTAIADQKAGRDLGFLNRGIYYIGQYPQYYAPSFHDITTGNNSAMEFDANNNPVDVTGYNAGSGWDAVTGFGSPQTASVVSYLGQFVTAGDGIAAINGSKPHASGSATGHKRPN